MNRVHYLRHSVSARLGREVLHQIRDRDGAQNRGQHHPRPPRRRRSVGVGIVDRREPAQQEKVMYQRNQRPERDGA